MPPIHRFNAGVPSDSLPEENLYQHNSFYFNHQPYPLPPNVTVPATTDGDWSRFFDYDAFQEDRAANDQHSQHRTFQHFATPSCAGSGTAADDTTDAQPADHTTQQVICGATYNESRPLGRQHSRRGTMTEGAVNALVDGAADHQSKWPDEDMAFVDAACHSCLMGNPLKDPTMQSLVADDSIRNNLFDELDSQLNLAVFHAAERWEVDRESAQFLASVVALTRRTDVDPLSLRLKPNFSDLRLDEPILLTDPQMDMTMLAERNKVAICTKNMEPFPLDIEKDQSFEWSKQSRALPATLDRKIAAEKLEVDYETMAYLKEIHVVADPDQQEWFDQEQRSKAWKGPFSPPLLSLSPPVSLGNLSLSAARADLTSTPDDPTVREAAELEDKLVGQDDTTMEVGTEEVVSKTQSGWNAINSYSSSSATNSSSPLKRKAKPPKILNVSSPILPDEHPDSSAKKVKTMSFQEEISTFMPTQPSDDCMDLNTRAHEAMAAIAKMIAPPAAPTIDRVNNEQFNEFDTILRVPVPPVDEFKPEAPWDIYQNDTLNANGQRQLLVVAQVEIMRVEKEWTGMSELERHLPWAPFLSHLGKLKPEGDFDDGSCTRYLAELEFDGEVDLEALLWKMDGLLVLDATDEERNELSYAEYEGAEEVQDEVDNSGIEIISSTTTVGVRPSTNTARSGVIKTPSLPPSKPLASRTSLEALLYRGLLNMEQRERALELRARQWTKSLPENVLESDYTPVESSPIQEPPSRTGLFNFARLQGWSNVPEQSSRQNIPTQHVSEPGSPPTIPPPPLIPTPRLHFPDRPLSIIVSSNTMANHHLTREISALLPNIDIVERDYTGVAAAASINQPLTSRGLEADMTLSPSTGLLLTTLQKLKQRPLPGQEFTGLSFHAQIATISLRYETLIILVTDGRDSSVPTLDTSDTTALIDLMVYTSCLEITIQIIFVPGRDINLAYWAATVISRHAYSPVDKAFNLLQENETLWERFLRKAGMNGFAAQAVLAQLKRPTPGEAMLTIGLAAFVKMRSGDRISRFSGTLEGQKVLQRVNKALEARWFSASND